MQSKIALQVRPAGTVYQVTIPALGVTVSGTTWPEAFIKACEPIGQARDAEAREILARKRQRKAGGAQHMGKTVA